MQKMNPAKALKLADKSGDIKKTIPKHTYRYWARLFLADERMYPYVAGRPLAKSSEVGSRSRRFSGSRLLA
jgi:hypothetical protein